MSRLRLYEARILKTLIENEPLFGQELRARVSGAAGLALAQIYSRLKQMEERGLISSWPDRRSNSQGRRLYMATEQGRTTLAVFDQRPKAS